MATTQHQWMHAAEAADVEVAAAPTSSRARTGWRWCSSWWAPCSVRSTMLCCAKRRQGMRRSDAVGDIERCSDRCDRKSCSKLRQKGYNVPCTWRLPDHTSARRNPLHSSVVETELVVLTDVFVDDQSQKISPAQEDQLGRSKTSECLSASSRALPSARCGGCPVAGIPIPAGHRCTWCHTCPHPGPSVYLQLSDGG